MLAVKGRVFIGKEWDPVTWDGDVWKDPTEVENFEPSGSRGFILPEVLVSLPSADILTPPPLTDCPFHF